MIVIIMGVSGSGKTTLGRALAGQLGWAFHDADDFHPAENLARMRRGEPLSDAEREPWLAQLGALMQRIAAAGESAVLACSALREAYRVRLREAVPQEVPVHFVYLRLTPTQAAIRVASRAAHFMPASLVASQFATLEEPQDAVVVDATLPLDAAVRQVLAALAA